MGFRFLTNSDALWVKVLQKKYNIQEFLPMSISRNNGSYIWCSLARIWTDVVANVYWSIGDGRVVVNLWNDHWVRQLGQLNSFCLAPEAMDNTLRVCDLVTPNGL